MRDSGILTSNRELDESNRYLVKIEKNIILILACFRRMLNFTQKEMQQTMGEGFYYLGRKELGELNPSYTFVHRYACVIAEKMHYNISSFFPILVDESYKLDDVTINIPLNVMKTMAKIVKLYNIVKNEKPYVNLTFDKINSEGYHMLLILVGFRRALDLSQMYIVNKLYISKTSIRMYEKGVKELNSDILNNYSCVIAQKLGVEELLFYSLLRKEVKKIQEVNQQSILNAICRIIKETWILELKMFNYSCEKNKPYARNIEKNIVIILGCFRRYMHLTL